MRIIKQTSTSNENREKVMHACPVSFTLDKIGGKWKPLILFNLRNGKLRYSELKTSIPSITEKMLIQHLKQLQEDGLLVRNVIQVMPPHVEYDLSKTGKELLPALNSLAAWGLKYRGK